MSEEELFNNDENMFLHQVENFYTAWGLVKICAQKCNLFKAGAGNTLTDNDSKCLNICARNIEATKKQFYSRVKTVFNAGGEGGEEGGADEE